MSNIKTEYLRERAFCLFNNAKKEANLGDNVKLKVIKNNIFSNKAAFVIFDENSAIIILNLDKIYDDNLENAEINLYKTLQHEIEHIQMIYNNKKLDVNNYNYLMVLMEYLYYSEFLKNRMKNIPFCSIKYLLLRKQVNRNSDCSPLEITADLISYLKTMKQFDDKITDEERKQYNKIILSLKFLNNNFEIFYDIADEPVNRFSLFVCSVKSYIKKNPGLLEEYSILKNVFNDNLELKSVYDLYTEINSDNEFMYSRLIIDYFITFRGDYSEFFKDECFKRYVENLFNQYIEKTIDYYNNINIGNVFVDDKNVLVDNLKMKKRNVLVLNSIAKFYGLDIIRKNILDSSRIYTYKKEQISLN